MAGTGQRPRGPLTREEVLGAAASLVVRHGPRALTMRGLAAELGTAVTSIYWHVGNRESLLDALVERTVRELGEVTAPRGSGPDGSGPRGRTPAARVVSLALALRHALRTRPHLIAMVHERGLTERMFLPAQRALVREMHAAGLRGARAAEAVRAVQFTVIGHLLVERARERAPEQHPDEPELWSSARAEDDVELGAALALPPDTEQVFTASIRALVDGLLDS